MQGKTRGISFSALGAFPVLHFVVPLALGIALGWYAHGALREWLWAAWASAAACAVALVVLAMYGKRWVENFGFYITAVLFFFFLGLGDSTEAIKQSEYPWKKQRSAYGGVVVSTPAFKGRVARFRVKVAEVAARDGVRRVNRVVEITSLRPVCNDTLRAGDAVMFYAKVGEPRNAGNPYEFDYASYLKLHGVAGTAFVYGNDVVPLPKELSVEVFKHGLSTADRVALWGGKMRAALLQVYRKAGIEGDLLGVVSAMTLGEKSLVSREVREVFSGTGTSHVLALSGLHLGILFSLLQYIITFGGRFRRMRVPCQVVAILFVWLYAVVAGMPQSLVRASVMCTLVCIAVIFRRSPLSAGNLYLAAFIILLFNPLSLFDVGFQLSFVSVLFILKLMPLVAPRRVVAASRAGKLWGFMAVSLCAQIGVAPLVAYYFHNFPTYFMMSNLVMVPASALIVPLSFALLAFSWLHPLAAVLVWLLKNLLQVLLAFLAFVAGIPGASLPLYPSLATVVMVYAVLLFLLLWAGSRRRIYVYPMLAVLVWIVPVQVLSGRTVGKNGCVWFYNRLSVSAAQFVVSPGESYLYSPQNVGDSAVWRALRSVSSNYWARCYIKRPVRLYDGFENRSAKFRNGLLLLGGGAFLFLDAATPHGGVPSAASVDAVFVSRGFRGKLAPWLDKIAARLVVLDSGMAEFRREKFFKECRRRGLRVHDMATEGALNMPLGGKQYRMK